MAWSKQKFCEINCLTNKLAICKLISRIIFQMKVEFCYFYTMFHNHIQICHKYFFFFCSSDICIYIWIILVTQLITLLQYFIFITALIFAKPLWINQHLQKIWDKLSLENVSGLLHMKSIFSKMLESAKLCVPKNMILARKKMWSNWIS